jgi:hypothetical protein
MRNVHELAEQAKQLSVEERRQLIEELVRDLAPAQPPSEDARRAGLEAWLALAGTIHSDYADVSTDKYKHLAEIYADNHDRK